MFSRLAKTFCFIAWTIVIALGTTATFGSAQEDSPVPEVKVSPNPTNFAIHPRQDQTPAQQLSDQQDCYEWTCEFINWDPYQAYEDLSDNGYATALTPEQMENGLICLAAQGAVAGAIAGEILGDSHSGAQIGVSIALASGLIHSNFLNEPDNPEAQRAISRFERNLKKWEVKYSGCLSRKGYRVDSDY